MSVYAYLRVSSGTQDTENQRFELLNFCNDQRMTIDEWVAETVSGGKSYKERQLGQLLERCKKGDSLVTTEISRLGRSLLDVMTVLNLCLEKGINVITSKERFQLSNSLNSKVISFCYALVADLEKQLIGTRTREALQRKKAEGIKLGRPKGSLSLSKLSGKEMEIQELLNRHIPVTVIGRLMNVSAGTVQSFIITRGLKHFKNKGVKIERTANKTND